MQTSKHTLLETLDAIRAIPMLVVGDIILDRYVWGKVERISPEAPVPVVEVKKSEDRLGGAGNVARNLKGLGASVSLCGLLGDDEEGETILGLLEGLGIERDGVIVDRARPTSLKTRIIASSQQIVRIDREKKIALTAVLQEGFSAVVDAHIDSARAVILSDYGKGAVSEILLRKLSDAAKAKRLGRASRPLVVDPHPLNYAFYKDITLAKPNRKEAELASGVPITDKESAAAAARALLKKWNSDLIMVTLGEDGLVLVSSEGQETLFLPTQARQVFDVSGAGDTVTAIFTAALASGASLQVAGDLANIGAGVVVSEIGTVGITRERLTAEIEKMPAN